MDDRTEPPAPGSLLGELAGEIPGELLDHLDRDPNAGLPPTAQVRALVSDLGLFGNQAVSTPELAQARAELLAFARQAIDALREGRDPDVPPTPEEETGAAVLSAFVVRPVLLIQDNEFVVARPPWESLERFRSRIQRSLPAVGRFALDGDLRVPLIGTGWVAAPGMVMTNRHVVKRFAAPVSRTEGEARWRVLDGIAARVDFAEEEEGAPAYQKGRAFDVPAGAEILVHPEADLALVPIAGASRGGESLAPVPLVLAAGGESMVEGRKVYAVGYPADDPLNPDPLSKNVLFQAIYRVKRLQPGQVMQVMAEGGLKVLHDCSTLGGNSGSCLVDLATNQVIGLHYAGYHRRANLAVALWDLVGDPLLRAAGVRFYGE